MALDSGVLQRFPHEMSGGQMQRVAIMRAAMLDPAVMLLDEPMAALDPLIRSTLQQELKAIFARLGKTVMIVTHDLAEAAFLAERITLLHDGRVLQTGSYPDLLLQARGPLRHGFHQGAAHLAGCRGPAMRLCRYAAIALSALLSLPAAAADRIVVGSKIFTEGYVLGELAAQIDRGHQARGSRGAQTRHGQHRHSVPVAEQRRHRCLLGLHRHARRSDSQEAAAAVRAPKSARRC